MQLRPLKILIVDDYAPSIAVLTQALSLRGHTCMGAIGIDDAFECAASLGPEVVFYEWNLRESTRGFPRRLRAASSTPLLVVAVSTLDEPDEFRTAEQIDGYLVKPVTMAQLEALLASLLRR